MAFMDTLLRLERLAHLINRKGTGTREDLARKLGVSARTVDNLLAQLRELCEVEIFYCAVRGSYCFRGEVEVLFEFIVPCDRSGKVKGGISFIPSFLEAANFLRRGGASLYCQSR